MPSPQIARSLVELPGAHVARDRRSVESPAIPTEIKRTTDLNFTMAAQRLGLSADQQLLLRTPFRELKVAVPVQMDDGSLRVFAGYRGRATATGTGIGMILTEHMKARGRSLQGVRVAIQGFGNVGSNAAAFIEEHGGEIIAVSDVHGGILCSGARPLRVRDLIEHVRLTGSVVGFPGSLPIDNEELIALPCDVLIPAALENALTEQNAGDVRAAVIVEGANLPTTAGADRILRGKNIDVIPDLLANAGGVVASYFEWTQNLQQARWPRQKVTRQLRSYLVRAYRAVRKVAETRDMSLREAAWLIAIDRVARAESLRGAPLSDRAREQR